MDNITISTPYDNTLTYYQNKTYMYQPDMSNGTLDDMVTAINPVLLVCKWGTNINRLKTSKTRFYKLSTSRSQSILGP